MQTKRFFALSLITAAMVSGCSTVPNANLMAAHSSYNTARSNADITNLAPLELKQASDSLITADNAFNKGESDIDVNHLAYVAQQQISIAEETAKRKTAETAVTNATAKRDAVRLDARTAEADTAKQQVSRDQNLIAEQDAQIKDLNAKKTDRGMVITLGDVLFNTNKAQLKAGGKRNIDKLGDFMAQYPQYKVLVEGYTDSVGSSDHNQVLSERRAASVQKELLDMAISGDRVSTRGYGEAFPVASNRTAGSRQLNRRVEIVLSDANGNIIAR